MAKELGLFRRGNVWTYRIRIPRDLLPAFEGKKELKQSLRTEDYRTAKIRRNRLAANWGTVFEAKRLEAGRPTSIQRRLATFSSDEIRSRIASFVDEQWQKELEQLRTDVWTIDEREEYTTRPL